MFVKITRNAGLNTTDKGQTRYLSTYLLTIHLTMLVKYCFSIMNVKISSSNLTLKIMQNAHKISTYTFEFETRRN